MDAASALADLTEISSHVELAAILDGEGAVLAATDDGDATARLVSAGHKLLREAGRRLGDERRAPTRIEAALRDGSVFVVRDGDRAVVARTRPGPPSALVLHDLVTALAHA